MFRHAGRAHVVGITGVPGSGKSTLVAKLAAAIRASGRRVGIVAIDPSSPFSGGAILGDRIRMGDLGGDPGVFVRSMATRGALGGLARGTLEAVDVLDAAGYDIVIIETVGVGQDEVEVARAAHTTVVVSAPGLGDDIQAIKAGILEIADIHVVSKCDKPEADRRVAELKTMLVLGFAVAAQRRLAAPGAADLRRCPAKGSSRCSMRSIVIAPRSSERRDRRAARATSPSADCCARARNPARALRRASATATSPGCSTSSSRRIARTRAATRLLRARFASEVTHERRTATHDRARSPRQVDAWERNEVARFLARAPERQTEFRTIGGLPLKRTYTALDLADTPPEDIGLPGQYPFTRGPYPTMYRGRSVDDAPDRRLRHGRGHERALQVPDRERPDRACRPTSTCRR